MLGVDQRLVEGITGNESAKRVDDMFQVVTGGVSEESAVLADATLSSTTESLNELMRVPQGLGRPVLNAITHRIHGSAMARDLGIDVEPAAEAFLGPAIKALGAVRSRRRNSEEKWVADIERNIAATRAELGADPNDRAAYQRGANQADD